MIVNYVQINHIQITGSFGYLLLLWTVCLSVSFALFLWNRAAGAPVAAEEGTERSPGRRKRNRAAPNLRMWTANIFLTFIIIAAASYRFF